MLTAITLVFAIFCKQAALSLSPNPLSKSPQKVLFKQLWSLRNDPKNKMKEKKPFYSFVVTLKILKQLIAYLNVNSWIKALQCHTYESTFYD